MLEVVKVRGEVGGYLVVLVIRRRVSMVNEEGSRSREGGKKKGAPEALQELLL